MRKMIGEMNTSFCFPLVVGIIGVYSKSTSKLSQLQLVWLLAYGGCRSGCLAGWLGCSASARVPSRKARVVLKFGLLQEMSMLDE